MTTKIAFTLIVVLIGILTQSFNAEAKKRAVSNGLISYWSLDVETIQAGTVKDIWGRNDGTIEGTPRSVPGRVGEALEFSGGGQSVKIVDPADGSLDFDARTDFTVEAWAKPENNGSSMRVIDKKNGKDIGYMLEHNFTDGFQNYANDGQGRASRVLEGMTHFGQWTHVVGVFQRKGDVQLFINGELAHKIPSDSQGKENISNSSPFYIGRRPEGEWWRGLLDEIRVYNRALTEEEVSQNFEARGGVANPVESVGKVISTWSRIKMLRSLNESSATDNRH